jgi:ABC-type multidrug transport system fused ATPase/permease subunit
LAIARAVFADPEILIFDEATSSLDSISERLVQEAIEIASQGKTVIMVAHRLSTVRRADKIIVLENGKMVEEGSHDELLERQGQYSRLVESQT